MNAESYLIEIKVKLALSNIVQSMLLMNALSFPIAVILERVLNYQMMTSWKYQNILSLKKKAVFQNDIDTSGWMGKKSYSKKDGTMLNTFTIFRKAQTIFI